MRDCRMRFPAGGSERENSAPGPARATDGNGTEEQAILNENCQRTVPRKACSYSERFSSMSMSMSTSMKLHAQGSQEC
jgi:hypothetical protein